MTKGSRVLGGLSGAVTGFGLAVLLQQFAIVPLTTAVLVGLPVGLAFVGVGAGWPRQGRRGRAPSTESHPGRPAAPPPGAGRPSAPPPSDQAPTGPEPSSPGPGGST